LKKGGKKSLGLHPSIQKKKGDDQEKPRNVH